LFVCLKLSQQQIYEILLTARFTPLQQEEYDDQLLTYAEDPSYGVRNHIDAMEERLMISPGTPLYNVHGFQRLIDARGLLLANKQLNDEANVAFFSKNTFLVPISEMGSFRDSRQYFRANMNTKYLPKIRNLNIVIRENIPLQHHHRNKMIAVVKGNIIHVVNALNNGANDLRHLKIRYISSVSGELERNRAAVDALLANPEGAPSVCLDREETRMTLTKANVRRFCETAYNISSAVSALNCPVAHFQIYGDVPSEVVERLEKKFKVHELSLQAAAEMEVITARRTKQTSEEYEAEKVRNPLGTFLTDMMISTPRGRLRVSRALRARDRLEAEVDELAAADGLEVD